MPDTVNKNGKKVTESLSTLNISITKHHDKVPHIDAMQLRHSNNGYVMNGGSFSSKKCPITIPSPTLKKSHTATQIKLVTNADIKNSKIIR